MRVRSLLMERVGNVGQLQGKERRKATQNRNATKSDEKDDVLPLAAMSPLNLYQENWQQ